ncbi:MAG TPA: aminotransferase class V-fold PLP-dependent enzyme [Anaeromyxobacteraceae bacterium]|nr:aminotransferase class V-fold PLP-dependent enzyme [Anaeromyxobacteraceae bacterium]
MTGEERRFLEAHPAYRDTCALDDLRAAEYGRLDAAGQVYLDWTGSGLHADSQLRQHLVLLRDTVLGNPHSGNPASAAATRLVESARRAVLEFFGASPDEYVAVFTANASGALKLVGESFPFRSTDRYLMTFDNHNSVNGIREFARARGAEIEYVPLALPDLRVDEARLEASLGRLRPGGLGLFAFPAQSNFSGVQHPLEWIERAQGQGWTVLLDAAAFAPTNRLDLGRWHPDFVPLSFYKMLGYPTGVGCLLARRAALGRLRRPWFAGGTITVASVQGDRYYLAPGEAAFEEGTPNYLALPAVEIGLQYLRSVGLDTVHVRVRELTGWLLQNLVEMRHAKNGSPLVLLYGPETTERRGATIAMNFRDSTGRLVDHQEVERLAGRAGISVRTGCFCNPGAGEVALGLSKPELVACFAPAGERLSLDDFRHCIDGKSSGAVRISLGVASNFADVQRFLGFARSLLA